MMLSSTCLKKYSFVFMILIMLLACGGGGEGGSSASTAPPTPNISVAASMEFGEILNNVAIQTLQVRNTGNAPLTIGNISKPNPPFSIPDSADSCSGKQLWSSQTCTLTVYFTPTVFGLFAGNISIPSDDPDSSSVNIILNGEGYGLNVWINELDTNNCPAIISVDVTVTDPVNPANNDALRTLLKDNFRLRHNGIVQNITLSPNVSPTPVSLVLALDTSTSLRSYSDDIKTAAKSMINQLGSEDEAAICKFNEFVYFYPDESADPLFITADDGGKTLLNSYIDADSDGGYTLFYEAVYRSIARADQGSPGKRRAIVVLSDGENDVPSPSPYTLDQVILYAKSKGIPVFTINGVYYGRIQTLQRLAVETGGQFYDSDFSNLNDLQSVFQQISNVLSNKYTITYTAPSCSGSLDVRVGWSGLYGQDSVSFPIP